jgi:uncharacterized membrane protein
MSTHHLIRSCPRWLQAFIFRPRFSICITIGILSFCLIPKSLISQDVTRAVVAWNIGSILYLLLASKMMFWTSDEQMRKRALKHDTGRFFVLGLVVISALVCMVGIVFELSLAKDLHGTMKIEHIALAVLTVVTAWTFTQLMFALHYAHEYYYLTAHSQAGGIDFPGQTPPTYGDFLYFACVIGTSGQTADVSFSNPKIRRTGLVHCVFSFFFNTTLVALMINIASGLI